MAFFSLRKETICNPYSNWQEKNVVKIFNVGLYDFVGFRHRLYIAARWSIAEIVLYLAFNVENAKNWLSICSYHRHYNKITRGFYVEIIRFDMERIAEKYDIGDNIATPQGKLGQCGCF